MAAVGGPNYTNALKEADARTGVAPLDIPCERCGGESRRESLKRRAHDITRSAAEIFAYCTSRTTSIEDSGELLSTFGNVMLVTWQCNACNLLHTPQVTGMTFFRMDFAQLMFNLGRYHRCRKPSCKGCFPE
jgi:hypothetical protein